MSLSEFTSNHRIIIQNLNSGSNTFSKERIGNIRAAANRILEICQPLFQSQQLLSTDSDVSRSLSSHLSALTSRIDLLASDLVAVKDIVSAIPPGHASVFSQPSTIEEHISLQSDVEISTPAVVSVPASAPSLDPVPVLAREVVGLGLSQLSSDPTTFAEATASSVTSSHPAEQLRSPSRPSSGQNRRPAGSVGPHQPGSAHGINPHRRAADTAGLPMRSSLGSRTRRPVLGTGPDASSLALNVPRVFVQLMYLSRNTTREDVRSYLSGRGLDASGVSIEDLPSTSSRVSYNSYILGSDEEVSRRLLDPSFWPAGLGFRRWFFPRRTKKANDS